MLATLTGPVVASTRLNPQFHPDDFLLRPACQLRDQDFIVAVAEGIGRTQVLDCPGDSGEQAQIGEVFCRIAVPAIDLNLEFALRHPFSLRQAGDNERIGLLGRRSALDLECAALETIHRQSRVI